MHDIFISYSIADQKIVEEIVNQLQSRYGIACWGSKNAIMAESNFYSQILNGIDNAKIVVFIHHKIRNLAFFEPFSDIASEKEKEEPGKKREIIRGTETRSGKTDNGEIFAEIKIIRYSNFSEHYASGRKTIEAKENRKGNHGTKKSIGFVYGFS